jgi:2-keto-3-deoxy-6-phosphogluconate aldolase
MNLKMLLMNVTYVIQYALAAEAVAALTAVYGTEYQIGSGTVLLCKNISHYKEL